MLKYFLFTSTIFLLSGSIFYMTITNIDPLGVQKNIGFLLFFFSLFLGVSSFFTLLFFFGKELIVQKHLGLRSFYEALRRGFFISIFVTGIVLLQLFQVLDIYETILFAILLSLIEYTIATNKKN